MFKEPTINNKESEKTNLTHPDLKSEVLDYIQGLWQEAGSVSNDIKKLQDQKRTNETIEEDTKLKNRLTIILNLITKSKENNKIEQEQISSSLLKQIEEAKEIMGEKGFLGSEAIEMTFGFQPEVEDIPAIPFNQAELECAQELKQFLILRIDKAPDDEPLTMKKMNELKKGKTKDGGKILYSNDEAGQLKSDTWYKDEAFFTKESPLLGWALVSKEVIPNSTSQDYLTQTETLVNYIENEVFKDQPLDKVYQEAIAEFKKAKEGIKTLMTSDWKAAGERLEKLKINNLVRQTPAEALYDILLMKEKNGKYILPNYTWTKRRNSGGELVGVSVADSDGVLVRRDRSDDSDDDLGVSFSRNR